MKIILCVSISIILLKLSFVFIIICAKRNGKNYQSNNNWHSKSNYNLREKKSDGLVEGWVVLEPF